MTQLQKFHFQINAIFLQRLHESLETHELGLQNLIISIHKPNDIKVREYTRAAYIHDWNEMVKVRKSETEKFDGIKSILMEFEKRADPKVALVEFDRVTLSLKKQEENRLFVINETAKERVKLTNSIKNAYAKIEIDYKLECFEMLNSLYLQALEDGSFPILAGVRQQISSIDTRITLSLPKCQYLELHEAVEIEKSIAKPLLVFDPKIIDDKFVNFDNDFKNREFAIKATKEAEADAIGLANQQLAETQDIAKIQQRAELQSVTVKPEFKAIKRNLQVVFDPQNPAQAREICNQFWLNELWNRDLKYISIQSFPNLTIQQMANALSKLATETGETIGSISYETVEK